MNDKEASPAARHANMIRARREVSGPLLRAALEPVREAIESRITTGGLFLMCLSADQCEAILAACHRADHGITL